MPDVIINQSQRVLLCLDCSMTNPYDPPAQTDEAKSDERTDFPEVATFFFFLSCILFFVMAAGAAFLSLLSGNNKMALFQLLISLLFLIPVIGHRRR